MYVTLWNVDLQKSWPPGVLATVRALCCLTVEAAIHGGPSHCAGWGTRLAAPLPCQGSAPAGNCTQGIRLSSVVHMCQHSSFSDITTPVVCILRVNDETADTYYCDSAPAIPHVMALPSAQGTSPSYTVRLPHTSRQNSSGS